MSRYKPQVVEDDGTVIGENVKVRIISGLKKSTIHSYEQLTGNDVHSFPFETRVCLLFDIARYKQVVRVINEEIARDVEELSYQEPFFEEPIPRSTLKSVANVTFAVNRYKFGQACLGVLVRQDDGWYLIPTKNNSST